MTRYLFAYFCTAVGELTDKGKAALMNKVIEMQLHKIPFLGFYGNGNPEMNKQLDLIIKTIGFVACRPQKDERIGCLLAGAVKIRAFLEENPHSTGGDFLTNFGSLNESRRNLHSFLEGQALKITEQNLENYNICVVGDPVILAVSLPHPACHEVPGFPEVWQWMIAVKDGKAKTINVVRRG